MALWREIAASYGPNGETSADIAARWGVSDSAIRQHMVRHRAEIEEIRANMDDEFAGLWIARKRDRIAVYLQQAEELADSTDAKDRRTLITALRNVAEEMGHLPTRVQQTIEANVKYELVGMDPDEVI